VFISYTWEGNAHEAWVETELATRLRADGCNVRLDRWEAAPGHSLPAFMETAVRESQYVLLVCTPVYKTKMDSRRGGVGYEGRIMTGEVFAGRQDAGKFIPILRAGEPVDAIPSWLLERFYLDLRGGPGTEPYERHYTSLVAALHGIARTPPDIGPPPDPVRLQPPATRAGTGRAINPPIEAHSESAPSVRVRADVDEVAGHLAGVRARRIDSGSIQSDMRVKRVESGGSVIGVEVTQLGSRRTPEEKTAQPESP
jgi:hypothetical protein